MNYINDFSKCEAMLHHSKLKQAFEFSPLFVDIFESSEYADGGFWKDDLWYYDDPKIHEYFVSFCDGYTQALVDYFIMESNEKSETQRMMNIQFREKDSGENIVIDFSQYLK